MSSALEAMYTVLFSHLHGASSIWGDNVEPVSIASKEMNKPYVVFFASSILREASDAGRNVQRLSITVKCVANTMQGALAGQDAISDLLHNSGVQDSNPRLPYNGDWQVSIVTEGLGVYMEEPQTPEGNVYHAGYQYNILMEGR